MRVPWKIVGLAGVAGVTAATGVVVARNRRDHTEYDPDELRDRLHSRVADAAEESNAAAEAERAAVMPERWTTSTASSESASASASERCEAAESAR